MTESLHCLYYILSCSLYLLSPPFSFTHTQHNHINTIHFENARTPPHPPYVYSPHPIPTYPTYPNTPTLFYSQFFPFLFIFPHPAHFIPPPPNQTPFFLFKPPLSSFTHLEPINVGSITVETSFGSTRLFKMTPKCNHCIWYSPF